MIDGASPGTQAACPWDEEACAAAAGAGHLDVLQFLRAQQPPCPWSEQTTASAALGGQHAVMVWLRNAGCAWGASVTAAAAARGDTEMLVWLRAQRPPCPWDSSAVTAAAASGHVDALVLLRGGTRHRQRWRRWHSALRGSDARANTSKACPWTSEACTAAAAGGHLAALQYLRSHELHDMPCPLDCRSVAAHGDLAALTWLLEEGGGGHLVWGDTAACTAAAEAGQLHVLQVRARRRECTG